MKQQSKFTTLRRQETLAPDQTQRPRGREFGSVEEMLRHDAAQNPAPAGLPRRLRQSLASPPTTAPKPAGSWWQRLFGRKPGP